MFTILIRYFQLHEFFKKEIHQINVFSVFMKCIGEIQQIRLT